MAADEVILRLRGDDANLVRMFRRITRLADKFGLSVRKAGDEGERTGRKQRGWMSQATGDVTRLLGAMTPIYAAHRAFSELFQLLRGEWQFWEQKRGLYGETAVSMEASRNQAVWMLKRQLGLGPEWLAGEAERYRELLRPTQFYAAAREILSSSGMLAPEVVSGAVGAAGQLSRLAGAGVPATAFAAPVTRMMLATGDTSAEAAVGRFMYALSMSAITTPEQGAKYIPRAIQIGKKFGLDAAQSIALFGHISTGGMDPEGAMSTTATAGILRALDEAVWVREGQVPKVSARTGRMVMVTEKVKTRLPPFISPEGIADAEKNKLATKLEEAARATADQPEKITEVRRLYRELFGRDMPEAALPLDVLNELAVQTDAFAKLAYIHRERLRMSPEEEKRLVTPYGARSHMRKVVQDLLLGRRESIDDLLTRWSQTRQMDMGAYGRQLIQEGEAQSPLLVQQETQRALQEWARTPTAGGPVAERIAQESIALTALDNWLKQLPASSGLRAKLTSALARAKEMAGAGDAYVPVIDALLPALRARAFRSQRMWRPSGAGVGAWGGEFVEAQNEMYMPEQAALLARSLRVLIGAVEDPAEREELLQQLEQSQPEPAAAEPTPAPTTQPSQRNNLDLAIHGTAGRFYHASEDGYFGED